MKKEDILLANIVDGVTIYNFPTVGTNGLTFDGKYENKGTYKNYVAYFPKAIKIFRDGTTAPSKKVFIPSAMPGFNNSKLYEKKIDNWLINRKGNTPQLFLDNMKSMSKFMDKDYPMLFIDAWNEYSEGSVIEPTKEYGDDYIKQIKNYLNSYK